MFPIYRPIKIHVWFPYCGKGSQRLLSSGKGHPGIRTRRGITLIVEKILESRSGIKPIDDLQTKLFIVHSILEPVDVYLLSSMWNEGSVLRLYGDNFEDSIDLAILEEVGFSCHCNGKSLYNQIGRVKNDRKSESDPLLLFLY